VRQGVVRLKANKSSKAAPNETEPCALERPRRVDCIGDLNFLWPKFVDKTDGPTSKVLKVETAGWFVIYLGSPGDGSAGA
jgi:hypothetical protein